MTSIRRCFRGYTQCDCCYPVAEAVVQIGRGIGAKVIGRATIKVGEVMGKKSGSHLTTDHKEFGNKELIVTQSERPKLH